MSNIEFTPQKGFSRFRGILVGTQNQNFYKEDVINGKAYRRLNFGIKTSPTNVIYVELFGMVQDKVYAFNKGTKETITVDWDKRHELPVGFSAFGATVDSKDVVLVDFDAIEVIKNQFKDGDSIFVNTENKFSTYKDKLQVKYIVKSIYHTTEPIDFEAENFEPMNSFTQDLTITDVEKDNEAKKLFVNAYIIEGKGKTKPPVLQPAQFTVRYDNENSVMVKSMAKVKFGTTMRVKGFVYNDVVLTEVEDNGEWGRQSTTIKDTRKEMEIDEVVAESVELKKYKESDFDELLNAQAQDKIFDEGANILDENKKENDDDFGWLND